MAFQPSDLTGLIAAFDTTDAISAPDTGAGECDRLKHVYDTTKYLSSSPGGFSPNLTPGAGLATDQRALDIAQSRAERIGVGTYDPAVGTYGANLSALATMWNASNAQNVTGYACFASRVASTGVLQRLFHWGNSTPTMSVTFRHTTNQYGPVIAPLSGGTTSAVINTVGDTAYHVYEMYVVAGVLYFNVFDPAVSLTVPSASTSTVISQTAAVTADRFVIGGTLNSNFIDAAFTGNLSRAVFRSSAPSAAGSPSDVAWVYQGIAPKPLIQAAASSFVNSIGINFHPAQPATPSFTRFYSDVLPTIDDLGVKRLRVDWATRDGSNNLIDLTASYAIIDVLRAKGVQFSLVPYGPDSGFAARTPIGDLTGTVIPRFAGSIGIIEGTNEPPITSGNSQASADWVALLKSTRDANGAWAGIKIAAPSYIQGYRALAKDVSASVDYGNLHPYPGSETPDTASLTGSIEAFMAGSQAIAPGKPTIVSEDGYNSALSQSGFPGVSEAERALRLPRMYLWNFIKGVVKTDWYEYISSFTDSDSDAESRFGLLSNTGVKRPCYFAMKNLIGLCNQAIANRAAVGAASFTRTGNQRGINIQRTDGANVLFAWIATGSTTSQNVTVSFPGATAVNAYLFGSDGNLTTSVISLTAGQATVSIANAVTAFESLGAEYVPPEPPNPHVEWTPIPIVDVDWERLDT